MAGEGTPAAVRGTTTLQTGWAAAEAAGAAVAEAPRFDGSVPCGFDFHEPSPYDLPIERML